jgi:hypothetical protein
MREVLTPPVSALQMQSKKQYGAQMQAKRAHMAAEV